MKAADIVLKLQLPKVVEIPPCNLRSKETKGTRTQRTRASIAPHRDYVRPMPANTKSFPCGELLESTFRANPRRRSPPQPETPAATRTSPPSSTLSADVDKVIQYLESFRLTHHKQGRCSENIGISMTRPASDRRNNLVVKTVLSETTHNEQFLHEEVGRVEGAKAIFRGTPTQTPPSPLAPPIHKANSIHSLQCNSSSPLNCTPENELDVSAVTNLITSICVENEGKAFDWVFLEKIQGKVEELLREVRKEREATHEWVKAVQESVNKWVQEQRVLIECERKHALERAAGQLSCKPNLRKASEKNKALDVTVSLSAEKNLYDIITSQAKKIEELEIRLNGEKSLELLPPAIKTPRYSQIPGSQGNSEAEKFFHAMENHESPTLPHILPSQVRAQREYLTTEDGRRLVKFRNGTEREYLPDGTLITRYTNGDVKTEGGKDKIIIYWHDAERTKQTSFPDGVQLYEYPNQQVERHFPDGRKEVTLPTGGRRVQLSDGTKVTVE